MLRTLLLSFTTLALVEITTAQNLVPNPSFEDTVNCGIPAQCSLVYAEHWYNPQTATTPDLWNCDSPINDCGFHAPEPVNGAPFAAGGVRFAGMLLWNGPGTESTDYLMTHLVPGMQTGVDYEVSVAYSWAEGYRFAVDHIGIWFGPDSVQYTNPGHIPLVPTLELRDPNSAYLQDGMNWVTLVDTIQATQEASWMIIGNFRAAADINGSVTNANSFVQAAYYFIDQVSVRRLNKTAVEEQAHMVVVVNDQLALLGFNGTNDLLLRIFDGAGRIVYERSAAPNTTGMVLPQLAAGLYTVQVVQGNTRAVVRLLK